MNTTATAGGVAARYNVSKHSHGVKNHGSTFTTTKHQDELIGELTDIDTVLYETAKEVFKEQIEDLETTYGIRICDKFQQLLQKNCRKEQSSSKIIKGIGLADIAFFLIYSAFLDLCLNSIPIFNRFTSFSLALSKFLHPLIDNISVFEFYEY